MIDPQSSDSYHDTRRYLFAVAYRMTGSARDAEDLVHDAWIRYLDAGSPAVNSLRAYLTTIISRLALDLMKSARTQREQYTGEWMPEPVRTEAVIAGPADTIEQREEVSYAFLILLERLGAEQRIVYVLREGFGLSYDEISIHLDKSTAACRQLFHRAQRILADIAQPTIAPAVEHRQLIEEFIEAVSTGNVAGVTRILAEDAFSIADGGPDRLAARKPILGRDRVARGLVGWVSKPRSGHLIDWEIVDLNGAPAIVIREDHVIDQVMILDIRDGQITALRTTLNLAKLDHLNRALKVNRPSDE